MPDCCTGPCSSDKPPVDARYRRILWMALVVNAGMFVVELIGGWHAGSVSLLADAVDFFGDAGNYAVSLFVLGLAPVWRSRTALVKGIIMGSYGLLVLGSAAYHLASGIVPESSTMGAIGFLALVANLSVAALLYAYRAGDANMRSVWLCSRNDAIGNIAVILAALGVYGTGSGLPDIVVATLMGTLGLTGAWSVVKHARIELATKIIAPLDTKI